MRRIARWIFAGFLTGAVATAAADAVSDFEVSRQQQRQSFEGLARGRPLVGGRFVREVLRMRLENRRLVLDTPLHETPGGEFAQVKLEDLPGTKLILVKRTQDEPGREELAYHLNVTDYTKPKQIFSLAVGLEAGQLQISSTMQYAQGGYRTVMIVQKQRPEPSLGGTVLQLIVNEAPSSHSAPSQRTFESADFFTFLREHPRESERYVRPLISQLDQDTLFGPEPLVLWQVFGDLWKPDPLTVRRVLEVLPRLDHPDYRVREQALTELKHLGRDGAAVMVHLDRTQLTPEQNVRVDRALLPYAQLAPQDAVKLRSDPGFLLDCLYVDDPVLRKAALDHLREALKQNIPFDATAPAPVRAKLIPRLREQFVPNAKDGGLRTE